MLVVKNFSLKRILQFTWFHITWITAWVSSVALYYYFSDLHWLTIPWLPLSIIGTAVAFYIGFKNNSSYDRLWEARKIWGQIVNSSRYWGSTVKAFLANQADDSSFTEGELHAVKKRLIYRHIAWLYALRSQLLKVAPWEHISQSGSVGRFAKYNQKYFGVGLVQDEVTETELRLLLEPDEYERMIHYQNTATQMLDQQAADIAEIYKAGLVNQYQQVELQNIIGVLYDQQGKCERIKKFPFPRQYAGMSMVFVGIFIFLLPFGMVSEFAQLGTWGVWLSIPFMVLVAWIYLVMELVGDYSENPFQGMVNDIPMLAISRTIEIDLREMLGETDLPSQIEARNGVLM